MSHLETARRTLRKGALQSTGSSLIERAIVLATGVLFAHKLGPSLFGVFSLALTIATLVYTVSLLGMDLGFVKFFQRYATRGKDACIPGVQSLSLLSAVGASTVFGGSLFLGRHWVAAGFEKPELADALFWMAPAIPFGTISLMVAHIFIARGSYFWHALIVRVMRPGLQFAGFVLLAYLVLEAPTHAAPGAFFASLVVCGALSVGLVLRHRLFSLRAALDAADKSTYVRFSFPIFLTSVFSVLMNWVDLLVVGYFLSTSDVGVYSLASRFSVLILIPLFSFSALLPTVAAKYFELQDTDSLKRLYAELNHWILVGSLYIASFLVLFGEDVLRLLGDGYSGGAKPLVILCAGRLFFASFGNLGYLLTMMSKPHLNLFNNVLLFCVNCLLCWLLIPRYGVTGAALGTTFSLIAVNLVRFCQVYYFIRLSPYTGKTLLLVGLSIASLYPIMVLRDFAGAGSASSFLAGGVALSVVGGIGCALVYFGSREKLA